LGRIFVNNLLYWKSTKGGGGIGTNVESEDRTMTRVMPKRVCITHLLKELG